MAGWEWSKKAKHRSEHKAKAGESAIIIFLAKMDIHPTLPNTYIPEYTRYTRYSNIPDFGVSTAMLNITDISHRWCKLNFEPLAAKQG